MMDAPLSCHYSRCVRTLPRAWSIARKPQRARTGAFERRVRLPTGREAWRRDVKRKPIISRQMRDLATILIIIGLIIIVGGLLIRNAGGYGTIGEEVAKIGLQVAILSVVTLLIQGAV